MKVLPAARIAAAVALLLAAGGCAVARGESVALPAPAPTVTVTFTPTLTPTATPGDDEDARVQPDLPFEQWRDAVDVLQRSDLARKPVKDAYSGIIREASYSNLGAEGVTVTLDRVTFDSGYRDGDDNSPDPIHNTTVKWQRVHLGTVMVLVDAGNGFRHIGLEELPAYVKKAYAQAKKADYEPLPFRVFTIGGKPVALVEWYLP
jgi:hypothetical protein